MAIALVQHVGASDGSNTSLAIPIVGVTAGNLLVLGIVTSGSGTTVTGVTDSKSNSWARKVTRQFQAGAGGSEIWEAYNVAVGNTTVTIAVSATVSITGILHEISGATTASDPFDTSNHAGGSSNAPNSGNTAVLSQAAEFILGLLSYAATTVTEDATFTTIHNQDAFVQSASKIVAATTAVSYAPSFSTSVAWTCTVATFKELISALSITATEALAFAETLD